MTSSKQEIDKTQERYSKAKRLHETKKKIEAKVMEAKERPFMVKVPLLDLPPIPKHEPKRISLFDSYDAYIVFSLVGFGFCLARMI